MSHYHAVVWPDHSEAHVFHLTPEDVQKLTPQSLRPHQHHTRGSSGFG